MAVLGMSDRVCQVDFSVAYVSGIGMSGTNIYAINLVASQNLLLIGYHFCGKDVFFRRILRSSCLSYCGRHSSV